MSGPETDREDDEPTADWATRVEDGPAGTAR